MFDRELSDHLHRLERQKPTETGNDRRHVAATKPRQTKTQRARHVASIIFYDGKFGFAKRDDDGSDVFVSSRELVKSGIAHALIADQRIAFDIATGTKGPRAINVALLD
jgi:cold shock CspA family protein